MTDHEQIVRDLTTRVRDVPDFPKPGILFKDITPILQDPASFQACMQLFSERYRDVAIDAFSGIESRGFIFGTALAKELDKGFIPIRKPGKLPYETFDVTYDLEYGTDTLEIHKDAVTEGQKVLLVDDLLATGGTMNACVKLVKELGADIVGAQFIIELSFLNGKNLLSPIDCRSLIEYGAE